MITTKTRQNVISNQYAEKRQEEKLCWFQETSIIYTLKRGKDVYEEMVKKVHFPSGKVKQIKRH